MNLADIKGALRLDLFDPAGDEARWSDLDLERAIARAVARYSCYQPLIRYGDIQARPYQRTYTYAELANTGYPVWWLERVLYPLQVAGTALAAPEAVGSALVVAGGNLGAGEYRYCVTYITSGGETTPSPAIAVTTSSGNQTVNLSELPIAEQGSERNQVYGRVLYRTLVGGTVFHLLAHIPDNITTSYSDTVADSIIAAQPVPPAVNTAGVMLWPALERAFVEQKGFSGRANIVAPGGNIRAEQRYFTLVLTEEELPRDSSGVLRVYYATGQRLDAEGTTIENEHLDLIVVGASVYAMQAYQVPTNDNFAFQDGAVYDRIDDSAIPTAWRETIQARMQHFEGALQVIQQQQMLGYRARVHWGDRPKSWTRL